MSQNLSFILIGAVAALFLLFNAAFIVNQTEQALVVQFGDIRRVEQEPGLKFKIPFVQNVIYFDKRILEFNAQPAEFITKDKAKNVEERVVIDAFVRYRITDPVQFYQAVKNEANLSSRLNSIVVSNMRKTIGSESLSDLLSERRGEIMRRIKDSVNQQASRAEVAPVIEAAKEGEAPVIEEPKVPARKRQGFGIEVVDVRIMRADLPEDISQATFERMRKNFTKEAQLFRAQGEERALEIRSKADRERTEIIANARKESETIRGQGDGIAAKIYADAFGRDPSFYDFYRTMQAYRATLKSGDTTMILSPESEFLNHLDKR